MAVSGSRDRTAIIWDLSRYVYVKTLDGHAGPVAATAVDELTGNVVTAAGSWLYLWTVNGQKVACIDTVAATNLNAQPVCLSPRYGTSEAELFFPGILHRNS